MTALLPVATRPQVRLEAVRLLRKHRRSVLVTLVLHATAVASGLVGPRILGRVVDGLTMGITSAEINRLALFFAAATVVQALLTRGARLRAALLGEHVLAELREDFLSRSVALPLGTVERAGTGDLVTRATTDIDRLSYAVRQAAPEIVVASVTCVLIAAAAFATAPAVATAMLVGVPLVLVGTRWHRRRADEGYRREMAAHGRVTAGIVETADAGRTIEALRLGDRRVRRTDDDIRGWIAAERYTLRLRSVWFLTAEAGYVLPIVGVVFVGGLLVFRGLATVGQVTAVALYVQMLIEPVDQVISWLDELQIGTASLARLLGVRYVPGQPTADDAPADDAMVADEVRFAYRDAHDVLHGISLDVLPGSRLAVVGPSGAGKSTLGRLLAGIHPPRAGSVTIGGAEVSRLPSSVLREQVALVTQEQHVFVGTVRDNVVLARPGAPDDGVRAALAAVDALDWVDALPTGLDTVVGSGGQVLSPAQAQQVALARLVLADRVAVVTDGRITEIGSHDELIADDGDYAALWESWRG